MVSRPEPRSALPVARTVALSKRDWLVFDHRGGWYRVAYYRPMRELDVDVQPLNRLNLEKMTPPEIHRRQGDEYVRFAGKHRDLRDALTIVLGEAEAPHGPDETEAYIRSTAWGAELP